MVDPPSRRAAAVALRQFAAGRITNDELEDRWPKSSDRAVRVLREAAWLRYSDLREYRLTGSDRLPTLVRKQVVRWVLFLHGELPYEWPVPSTTQNLARDLVSLITLGVAERLWTRQLRATGELEVWPFIRRSDFRAALTRRGSCARSTDPTRR